MTREQVQRALEIVYGKVFNEGLADRLPGLVSGPYIQHNPLFPNGLEGIMGYIKQARSKRPPSLSITHNWSILRAGR
jgi:predicted SnoaL-like aldol condensation-catalyzing enzyme